MNKLHKCKTEYGHCALVMGEQKHMCLGYEIVIIIINDFVQLKLHSLRITFLAFHFRSKKFIFSTKYKQKKMCTLCVHQTHRKYIQFPKIMINLLESKANRQKYKIRAFKMHMLNTTVNSSSPNKQTNK